ncbi:MAG TPA: septum formation initiator family protein [Ignavibacteria bacterium]|nr:septum formation initiator family protein [Ignavibacteria bacterium]
METERDGLFNSIARFMKYNTRIVLVIIFFAGLLSLAVFGNKGILQRYKLEAERKELEKQLDDEYKKAEVLRKEIEELRTSDEKMEKVAREKYGMTKEGETIQKVIIDSTK